MIDLGIVRPGTTIRIPFSSFDKDDGSSITMTNFAASDILVYKDGSTTERASTAGFTATTDFDSKTGKHFAIIDLADNTTAGFWTAGSEYHVALDAVTVDAVTVGGWIARFRIGYPGAVADTTIATLSSQTSFTLTTGPAEDDALKGLWAIIHDIASAVQFSWVQIYGYTGSTKTITLSAGAKFTAAAGDNISIFSPIAEVLSRIGVPGMDLTTSVNGILTNTSNILTVLGTPVGISVSQDIFNVKSDTAALTTDLATANLNILDLLALGYIRKNTAQAGAATSITLDTGASSVDNFYQNDIVFVYGATGAGQARRVLSYVGSTRVATVDTWITNPASGSLFFVVPGSVTQAGSLATQAKADVNAEVLDVLNTDTFAEPGQEAPGTTVSLVRKIGYLYKVFRNKKTQTASTFSLFADDASTVDQKATVSDDGTTTTVGEISTGP